MRGFLLGALAIAVVAAIVTWATFRPDGVRPARVEIYHDCTLEEALVIDGVPLATTFRIIENGEFNRTYLEMEGRPAHTNGQVTGGGNVFLLSNPRGLAPIAFAISSTGDVTLALRDGSNGSVTGPSVSGTCTRSERVVE